MVTQSDITKFSESFDEHVFKQAIRVMNYESKPLLLINSSKILIEIRVVEFSANGEELENEIKLANCPRNMTLKYLLLQICSHYECFPCDIAKCNFFDALTKNINSSMTLDEIFVCNVVSHDVMQIVFVQNYGVERMKPSFMVGNEKFVKKACNTLCEMSNKRQRVT